MSHGHKFRPDFVPVVKNTQALSKVLRQQDSMLILEELAGMRAITLYADAKMKDTGWKNMIQQRSKQICNGEKDDVIFNFERTAGAIREARFWHINFP